MGREKIVDRFRLPIFELVVGGSVTVRVPRDFDEATLKRVVRALS